MAGIIGIDPGFGGGICALRTDLSILALEKMPVRRRLVSRRTVTTLDLTAICKLLSLCGMRDVIVEKVHASPQMGVSSAFNFGRGFGALEGVLVAKGFKIHYAEPSVWKPKMGLSSDKAQSLTRFKETFGTEERHDGKAEAALLAWYGVKNINLEEEDPLS